MTQLEITPHVILKEPSRFERLLAEISTFFINLPADQIDSEIEVAQRRVCELLDLDRSTLFQTLETEPGTLVLTHLHQPAGSVLPPERMNLEDFFPWSSHKIRGGETLTISKMTDLPADADRDHESFRLYGAKSVVVVPLSVGRRKVIGLLTFSAMREEKNWPETIVQQFEVVAQIFANALARKQTENRLRGQLEEIRRLKLQLEEENIYLRQEIELHNVHEEIVGRSSAMKEILAQVEQVAGTDATVLIEGETGTGKELLAHSVHRLSARKDRPLVTVNCGSLPPTLIESELFGREKGAYTGALTRMTGRFEVADGATLFLDEIGELPHDVQAKLLRVLEEGRFERLGSTKPLQVNVRIIAATNRDLSRDVAEGIFRKDLYYRLNVFPIVVPPLRERPEDIPLLVYAFVRQYEKKMGKRIEHVPRKTMEALQSYSWPGNARELRNVVEHAMIVSSSKTLDMRVPQKVYSEMPGNLSLEHAERRHILDVLQKSGWRVRGQGGAAEILGLKRTTLQSKMKKLGIQRPTK